MRGTLIAIPAYNEGRGIGDIIEKSRQYADHVIVIDDGSDDDTAVRARNRAVPVVRHAQMEGYGAALKTAFKEAHRRNVDRLVVCDGDGTPDPAVTPALIRRQNRTGADFVAAKRAGGRSRSLGRRLVASAASTVARGSGSDLHVDHSIRLFGKRPIRTLANDENVGSNTGIDTNLVRHARRYGYQIALLND